MRVEVIVCFIAVSGLVHVSAHPGQRSSGNNYYRRNNNYEYPLGGSGRFDRYGGYGRYGDILNNVPDSQIPELLDRQCRQLIRGNCPLFDVGSNLVTRDDFINKVVSEDNGWFPYLAAEIDAPFTYGKCEAKYGLPEEDGTFLRPEVCFNINKGKCVFFNEIMRYEEDECGRVKIVSVNFTSTERIYSQDLDQYFWRYLCINTDSETECAGERYIDLDIKRDRFLSTSDRIPDMTGLPWDKIAADLKYIFGRDLSDPEVKHGFLGTECNLI